MGRLDIINAMFAGFGIVLALAGFIGIWVFRREVLAEAKDEVARLVPDEVRRLNQQYFPRSPAGNGGQVYTPSDVPYISTEVRDQTNEPERPASDDTPASEPSTGSGDSDGASAGA